MLPSDRRFGRVFALIFAGVALYCLWREAVVAAVVFGLLATTFALAVLVLPSLLHPLNRLWYKLGLLLGMVVGPVVLGVLFFGVITPVAVLMRLAGRDELALKRRPGVASHWVVRDPPGPDPQSFRNQF